MTKREWEVWNYLLLRKGQVEQEREIKAIPNLFSPGVCEEKQRDRGRGIKENHQCCHS